MPDETVRLPFFPDWDGSDEVNGREVDYASLGAVCIILMHALHFELVNMNQT